jgi:hypothetical protein
MARAVVSPLFIRARKVSVLSVKTFITGSAFGNDEAQIPDFRFRMTK